jgi:hypothetical protein
LDILAAFTRRASSRPPRAARHAFCDIVGDQIGEMETNEFLNLGETLIPVPPWS